MTTLTWLIEFDWNNDGVYEANEANRVTQLALERGRSNTFADFEAGKAVLTLENNDRRFDPWYGASPLYPNVAPRRRVKIGCSYAGTTYPLFVGRIEEIEPMGATGQRTVTITAYDGLRDMSQEDVDATLRENITNDNAIGVILDAISWPAGDRDLDMSVQEMAYWWTKQGGSPRERIDEIARSEHGAAFVGADGKLRFINREGYTTGAIVATIDEDDLVDIALANPWEAVFNGVDVQCFPVAVSTSAVLWTLNDREVYLAPGESVVIWAPFADTHAQGCAADDVETPIMASTDYTANLFVDGTGDDLTSSLTVSTTVYSSRAKLTCTNAGAVGLYITLLQVRGKAITQTVAQVRAEDAPSQATYGRRWLTIDVPWQQSVARGKDLATALVSFFKTPRPPATVQLAQVLPDLLDFELCDRVRLVCGSYSLDQTMQVVRINLKTGRTMQELLGTLYLEPAETQVSWRLGLVGSGELGLVTWLGY